MGHLYTEIEIGASAESVWNLLTDFKNYPSWNPFILYASGEIKTGARLKVHSRPPGAYGNTQQPIVTKVVPYREFRWLGRLFIPFLLDGEHVFTIEPLEGDRVRFIHREIFGGLLVPIHRVMRFPYTRRGFEVMNQALKDAVEGTS